MDEIEKLKQKEVIIVEHIFTSVTDSSSGSPGEVVTYCRLSRRSSQTHLAGALVKWLHTAVCHRLI